MKHKRYKIEVFTTENSDNLIVLLDLKSNIVYYAFTPSYSAFTNYGSSYDRLMVVLKQAPYNAVSVLKGFSNSRNHRTITKKVKTLLAQKEESND